jgi:hypothetical protein
MDRDEADLALRRVRGERDRVTSVLLDLEGQRGYRLLGDAPAPPREFDRVQADPERLRATVRSDPLSIGPEAFDGVAAALAALESAVRIRREHAERMRRIELRGRLSAYRAKAGRLGHSEDPELTALYEQARDLLWTAPCDLRQATATLAEYQRASGDRT